jgi:L-amino acid N-acyltransferase YncA
MHFDHNEATRRINERLGFQQMGHLTEIAMVLGQRRGLVIWALRIPAQSTPDQALRKSGGA